MAGTMRRVVAGSKSEGERLRRQSVREEMAEALEAVGVPTGGFAGAGSVRERMSPQLLRQVAQLEEVEAREQARIERAREVRVAAFAESANRAAIAQALEAGEDFHPRMLNGQGLGHTPRELIEQVSARQELEDMRFEAEELAEFRKWKAQQTADTSADTSAPTARQREAAELQRARAAAYRRREQDRRITAAGIRSRAY